MKMNKLFLIALLPLSFAVSAATAIETDLIMANQSNALLQVISSSCGGSPTAYNVSPNASASINLGGIEENKPCRVTIAYQKVQGPRGICVLNLVPSLTRCETATSCTGGMKMNVIASRSGSNRCSYSITVNTAQQ